MVVFSNKFFFTFLISFAIHMLIFIFFFEKKQTIKIDKYKIMNLASFKDYEPPQLKQEDKKTEKIENKEEKEKMNTLVEEQIVKKIKKAEKKESINIKKPEKKIIKELKKPEPKEIKKKLVQSEKKIVVNKNQLVSRNTYTKNDKKIQNKELEKYFLLIVEEMTLLAKKSYPRRSRMLEEEGKILIEVKINNKGLILNTKLKTKKPKRLANAAVNLLKRKKQFPNPPQYLFKNLNFFSFEIPINFILK